MAKSKPYPHYDDFASFASSAAAGCELCKLVYRPLLEHVASQITSLQGSDANLSFELCYDDILRFTIRGCPPDIGGFFCEIQLNSNEGDPATQILQHVFTTRLLAKNARSRHCYTMARYWLKTCLETHTKQCPLENWQLPSRVVDVGLLGDAKIRIHVSKGEVGHWFTLSHCWGGVRGPVTTTDNLSMRCSGFFISELPRTFRDAVAITRKLGYRYLWIDSLCILQDSEDDWLRESGKMAEVYSRAILTITAEAARDSNHGIFKSSTHIQGRVDYRQPTRTSNYVKLPVHSSAHDISTTIYARRGTGYIDSARASVLQQRAWAFQEAALSRRKLRYTPHGILWSCDTVPHGCHEQHPHRVHNLRSNDYMDHRINSIFKIPNQVLPPQCTQAASPVGWNALRWWYHQINNYAGRRLSYANDRFPALSGLAKEFAHRTGYHYRAGIWAQDSRRGLLWTSHGNPVRWDHAPSWSWAAVKSMPNTSIGRVSRVYECCHGDWDYLEGREVKVIDISVANVEENQFGQIVSAKLHLRGLCRSFKSVSQKYFFLLARDDSTQTTVYCPAPYQEGIVSAQVLMDFADDLDELCKRVDVIIVQICRFRYNESLFGPDDALHGPGLRDATFGLVLEPCSASDYRKIGMVRMPDGTAEEPGRWETKDITII
ncbi:hypothetical protein EG329_000555 [Mollisiaceae sp. DMI_Dod_QoI]|nr:hypothetical protein EG329_000555 [Helotiales sp. DMI_Dod_QoI]